MTPISARIKDWMDSEKLTPGSLATVLGYSQAEKLYRLFREEKEANPSVEILRDISNMFVSFDLAWIITGKNKNLATRNVGLEQDIEINTLSAYKIALKALEAENTSLKKIITLLEKK